MICKNCSAEFEGKFCPECGAPCEQEIEQVAEQVAEAAAEPVIEAADTVVESVTPPVADDEGFVAPEPTPESYYHEPARNDAEVIDVPKKKGKKVGLIIALVIIVLAAAAFCVTAFTDLIFPKQAQFISVLKNMGSEIDADFDMIDSEYIETKYSVKVNGENDLIETVIPKEYADMINSLSFTAKQSKDKFIMSAFENGKKLADVSALIKEDDEVYIKTDFSDVVIKYSMDDLMSDTDYKEAVERIEKVMLKEITAALESKEPVKGEYSGSIDIGADVKVLTITLNENEINEIVDKIIKEAADAFDLSDIYETPAEGFGIKEITVSALYDGAFSFARNSLGMYIVIDDGKEKVEAIYYSNNENKAIYGVSAEDGKLIATDNYEINGNSQTGYVDIETDVEELEMLSNISITYTAKNNSVEAQAVIAYEGDEFSSKVSMVNENGVIKLALNAGYNQKELVSVTAEMSACEKFDVEIDTSKAVDFGDYKNFDAREAAMDEIVADLKALVEENEDSKIFALLKEAFPEELTVLEQFLLDNAGIEYEQVDFSTANRASYVIGNSQMIDVQTFGYEGDIIKEMSETVYLDVYGYTESEQQEVLNSLKANYASAESLEDAVVTCELRDDYVVVTVTMCNLDNPQNVKAFINAGLIMGDAANATQLSFSQSAAALKNGGYTRVE